MTENKCKRFVLRIVQMPEDLYWFGNSVDMLVRLDPGCVPPKLIDYERQSIVTDDKVMKYLAPSQYPGEHKLWNLA